MKGTVKRPNLGKLRKEEKKDEQQKPKKFFKFGKPKEGSGNEQNAFAQMMRHQMAGSASEKKSGPKQVDVRVYEQLAEKQTLQAQEALQPAGKKNTMSGMAPQVQAQIVKMGL